MKIKSRLNLRNVLAAAILLAAATGLPAQDRKYGMWYTPSRATDVYGVMFNFFPREASGFPHYSVYGAELNLNPLGLFMPPVLLVSGLFDPAMHQPAGYGWDGMQAFEYEKRIYGLQIAPAELDPYIIYGLDLSLSGSFESVVIGAGVSLIINRQDAVYGLTAAPAGNHNLYCRGLQIGLVNTCSDLQGIQIGLWNVNQKRKLPLINWNFKSQKEKQVPDGQLQTGGGSAADSPALSCPETPDCFPNPLNLIQDQDSPQ